MASESITGSGRARGGGGFQTTRWSIVLAAGDPGALASRDALSTLCETYWYPLYAFARRRGETVEQAEDLTQGFFARLLEKNELRNADRERGKFRTFLLTAFKYFIANEWDRAQTKKRGGHLEKLHLDYVAAESRYSTSLSQGLTPDQEFEQQWALSILDGVLAQLAREYELAGKGCQFEALQAFLPGAANTTTYEQCAETLARSVPAVKMAVSRLRGRYKLVLREWIASTLEDPKDVEEEIRYLLNVMSG